MTIKEEIKFSPGSLFQKSNKDANRTFNLRLYRIPFNALKLTTDKEDGETYQHHLVTNDFIDLVGDEYLFLLHFFISPNYVQYYPNEEIVQAINNKFPCVAYFLYEKSIWSTNIYSSIEDFKNDFTVVVE